MKSRLLCPLRQKSRGYPKRTASLPVISGLETSALNTHLTPAFKKDQLDKIQKERQRFEIEIKEREEQRRTSAPNFANLLLKLKLLKNLILKINHQHQQQHQQPQKSTLKWCSCT